MPYLTIRSLGLAIAILSVLVTISHTVSGQRLDELAAAVKTGNSEQKRDALMMLRGLCTEAASRAALPALADPDPMVRATAASAVLSLSPAEAVTALSPLAKDKDPFVRREALFALGAIGDAQAVPVLIASLKGDSDLEVRAAAAAALGMAGDLSALESLTLVLAKKPSSDSEFIRRASARSLGQVAEAARTGHRPRVTPASFLPQEYKSASLKALPSNELALFGKTVEVLLRVLADQKEAADTRREAAFALGAIGHPSAVAKLRGYSSADDPYLAEICREALLKFPQSE
jgi:HEAT repeat protein